jgi:uncharacterized protein (TIGR03032 family)
MSRQTSSEDLWAAHDAELRDPRQIAAQWTWDAEADPKLLEHEVQGRWWEVLASTGCTLLATREYEHLVVALGAAGGRPRQSHLRLPHPSGLAVREDGHVCIASTRNPNIVYELAPCQSLLPQWKGLDPRRHLGTLLPARCAYLPGCLYLHDLALIGGRLHGNAVGLNAVVELDVPGGFQVAWWPRAENQRGPRLDGNYLQLNSIAAGQSLNTSYFSASAAAPSRRRPGHRNFPVDRRGVIFSGKTRRICASGLTRPHSARLRGGELWVDNSGYGEVGRVSGEGFEPVARLAGWTRGLCFHEDVVFVGTSRVIPRFECYAPGVDPECSRTGIHALDVRTGQILGSLLWPRGNQIFALELVPSTLVTGFPFSGGGRPGVRQVRALFFAGTPHPAEKPTRPRRRAES